MTGQQLRYIREGLGLTQKAMAGLLDVSELTILRYENNQNTIPRVVELAVRQIGGEST